MKHTLLLFYIVFSASVLPLAADDYRDINVRRLTTEEGLSQNTVNSIYQDEFGFIWIGTMDGLNRYDGRSVEIFRPDPADSLSIRENNIRFITGDGDGHIYIKGLESVTQYDMRSDRFRMIASRDVRDIHWACGKLWMATGNEIYAYSPGEGGEPAKYFSFADEGLNVNISRLCVTRSGEICLSTAANGYYRINRNRQLVQHFPAGEANQVFEDSDGNIWLATRNEGLWRIAPSGETARFSHRDDDPASLNHDNVRYICQDENGNFFVGTFHGLSMFYPSTGRFVHYRYEFKRAAFKIRSILTMMRDRQGTLWIGTFYEGLQSYNTEYDVFHHYYASIEMPGRLTSPVISSVAEDDNGRIWIGTEGDGLNCLDRATGTFRAYRKGNSPSHIASDIVKSLLYEPQDNVLWVGTIYDGMDRMDLSTGRVEHFDGRLSGPGERGHAQNIVKITSAGDSLLLGTNKGLVVFNKKTKRMTRFDTGFTPNRRAQIWDIEYDRLGRLWLTSSTDLLRIDPPGNAIRRYTFAEISGSFVNNNLNSVMCDSRGQLWFGSSGSGVFLYEEQSDSFRNYNTANGLVNNFITGMFEDVTGGEVFIATNGGLSCFNPHRKSFENHNARTGFPITAINDNSLYITRDGEIFACGFAGMISFRPQDLRVPPRNYDVYVSNIDVNNSRVRPNDPSAGILSQSVLYQKRIRLRPTQSVITFHFASNDFSNSTHSGFEYRLRGFDPRFIASDNNYATYTNLNPGRYTFEVRGSTRGMDGRFPSCTLEVVVMPPFYKSWWFLLLCSGILLALVLYIVRAYAQGVQLRSSLESEKREKAHQDEVNQSKLRFFTNISHEFRTPLTLIDAQLEILLQKSTIRPTVYARILSAYKNSQRMRRLVDEIIDIRKQDQGYFKLRVAPGNIVDFLREVCISFEEYAKHNDIKYTFRAGSETIEMRFDPEQMEKVIYNLLSNAFKYTSPGGHISVAVEDGPREVEITVTDDGKGISPEYLPHVFERFSQEDSTNEGLAVKGSGVGLSLTRAIVEMHGGTIEVESVPAVRTCFRVVLDKEYRFDDRNVHVIEPSSQSRYIAGEEQLQIETPEESADKSVKMLIVEDNSEVRNLLAQIFSPIYTVHLASDGQQGIEAAEKVQPDLILSDIMMPVMSGMEMCRRLKSDMATCHIPIILLTARTAAEHQVEGLLTGADDYVTKPFHVKLLVARCHNLVANRRRIQQKFAEQPDAPVEMLSSNPEEQELLRRAIEVVEKNLDNVKFDVQMFSREMALSRTYLFAKIKGLTGQTPSEFVTGIRLKRAAAVLVANPRASMSDIAYDLGFSSSSYFIKCFKDAYGQTPNAYRKEHGRG